MPDINTRLEKFYTEHPEARPADSVVSLHYIGDDWCWCDTGEAYDMSDADVIRMAICPDSLNRDALVQIMLDRGREPCPTRLPSGSYRVFVPDHTNVSQAAYFKGPTILEALLAAAEAVGGEG